MELVAEKYKQTEVGLIPSDWAVKSIRDVCVLINGRGFKPFEWKKEGLPIIRIQNLNGSNDYNYYDGHYDKKIEVENGQLLFAWSGSRGTSFGPHIWFGTKALLNYHTWKIVINEDVIVKSFFNHALKVLTKHIEDNAHGASALVHTQKWEMEGFKFPVPLSKAEQIAIATALSDADALISSLEKLIAKKRNIKQGAMQKLLQPKEGWEVKKLGEVIYLQGGYAFKSELFKNVGVPIIRISDVGNNKVDTDYSVCYEPFNIPKEFVAKKGDVLIAMSGATTGKIGIYNYDGIAYINQRVGKFVVLNENETSQEFISHIVRSEKFKENLTKEIAQGAQPNISGKQIQSILLPIPNEKEEQTRNATILSDMDAEISALETKLEKYRKVKLGMMQNLLTGKIRLI
ncbi:restriction endonuclease subunit S [Lacibacter sp.]|uniref:restriction endonuclease subunit S n=1 Tax=Lacibacter sp. TaxID=1915409 RepID=UPI002B4AF243|nr:restriction endonuclease subunit S [Lacibacter sp.]HLP37051.1 restriction endonuclease subunit S [Lacibacter sp.]